MDGETPTCGDQKAKHVLPTTSNFQLIISFSIFTTLSVKMDSIQLWSEATRRYSSYVDHFPT